MNYNLFNLDIEDFNSHCNEMLKKCGNEFVEVNLMKTIFNVENTMFSNVKNIQVFQNKILLNTGESEMTITWERAAKKEEMAACIENGVVNIYIN